LIVAISGVAGSGKDSAADALVAIGFERMALADPMKRFAREVYGFTDDQLWGPSSSRNAIDPRWGFSPREALQRLGTEWGRSLHPETWIRCGLRAARGRRAVFTDIRFENELRAFRDAGAFLIRVVRPGAGLVGDAGNHPSETEQASIPDAAFDLVIRNEGTIADLRSAIVAAVAAREAAWCAR